MYLEDIPQVALGAARMARRRVVSMVVTGACLVAGGGFATAGIFLALLQQVSPIAACALMAIGFLAIALIVMAVTGARPLLPHSAPTRYAAPQDPVDHLITTFVAGIRAGRDVAGPR